MLCPFCKSETNRVTHTNKDETRIRRRRECLGCLSVFHTIEGFANASIDKSIPSRMADVEARVTAIENRWMKNDA